MFIKLNKIERDHPRTIDPFSDTDDVGEPANTVTPAHDTKPVAINTNTIRCYYPRKDNRPGTRITFTDGGGFAVSEPVEYLDVVVGLERVAATA